MFVVVVYVFVGHLISNQPVCFLGCIFVFVPMELLW